MANKVSLIIPAYNEENWIRRPLESAKRQFYAPDEIIVVANGCTDRTAETASEYTPHVYEIEGRGVSRAKNFGIERATGNLISFLDADTEMSGGVINEMVAALSVGKYVGGKAKIKPDSNDPAARAFFAYVNFCNALPIYLSNTTDALKGLPQSGAGAFIFSDISTLARIKDRYGSVFNEELQTMEDVDITKKMRELGKLRFLQSPVITSTRRFENEGYARAFLNDFFQYFSPKGKNRAVYR